MPTVLVGNFIYAFCRSFFVPAFSAPAIRFFIFGFAFPHPESSQLPQFLLLRFQSARTIDPAMCDAVAGIPYRKRKPCSCQNGAECDAQGRCLCRAGFTGARCELRVHLQHHQHQQQPAGKLSSSASASASSNSSPPDALRRSSENYRTGN